MRAILIGAFAIFALLGCASKVETSGHSTGDAIYWGETVGYAQINPELSRYIPEITEVLKKKGLTLNTKSPYASLQLEGNLRSSGQGLSLTFKLIRIKNRDRGVLVFPLQGTTIATSYAQVEGQALPSDRKATIAQLVNQALVEFSSQLDKSKPGALRAIPL